MGEMRNVYRSLVIKLEGMRSFGDVGIKGSY